MAAINVVFTGPASDAENSPILRADLTAAAVEAGMTVQRAVRADTHMLVASRVDTVKAREAAHRGLVVVSYPTFLAMLGRETIPQQGALDLWVDSKPVVMAQPAQPLVSADIV